MSSYGAQPLPGREPLVTTEQVMSALQHAPTPTAIVGPTGTWLHVNTALCELLGYAPELLLGSSVVDLIHPDDRAAAHEAALAVIEGGRAAERWDMRLRAASGTYLRVSYSASALTGAGDHVAQLVDVTPLHEADEELEQLRRRDPLTRLLNRPSLLDQLERMLGAHPEVAVLHASLDRFQLVNASLGHAVGDRVLVEVARRIERLLPSDAVLARTAGDEFAVIEPLGPDRLQPSELAAAIECSLREPFRVGADEVVLTASVGIRTAAADDDPEDALRDAATASTTAKLRGRGRAEIFTAGMRALALDRLQREAATRNFVRGGHLDVHLQPVRRLRTGEITGFEALVRARSNEGDLVLPGQFLAEAEESGLIIDMGAWVLSEACRTLSEWRAAYPDRPPRIAVNVSARQVTAGDFADHVLRALAEHAVPAQLLSLELTESLFIEASQHVTNQLDRLAAAGVALGIDDFGTGWSSLSYLRRLPLQFVKIDQSFVAGLGRDTDDTSIIAAVIGLGRALGLAVVAEGIETREQEVLLDNLGCELGQGWHLGRPMPAGEATQLLARARTMARTDR